jgi:hypothetical protein
MKIRVMEWQAFLNTVVHPKKFETVLLGWSLGFECQMLILCGIAKVQN